MAILTVSREFGCGGTEIGKTVAAEMGYEYVDRAKILDDLRRDGRKWEEWAQELDEHCPSVWERYDWSFRGFAALIQSHVLEHATKDRVVIMGRGANFLLEGIDSAYRTRVVGPVEARVDRIVKREQVSRDTARWLVQKTDSERSCFIHSVFDRHWEDPAGYDAVFEVAGESVDDVVQAMMAALKEREHKNTDEVQKVLRLRTAAARVKAGIATNSAFFVPVLDVVAEGEGLVLQGVTHTPKEHRRLEEEARKLAGDLPLRCDLHYRK